MNKLLTFFPSAALYQLSVKFDSCENAFAYLTDGNVLTATCRPVWEPVMTEIKADKTSSEVLLSAE